MDFCVTLVPVVDVLVIAWVGGRFAVGVDTFAVGAPVVMLGAWCVLVAPPIAPPCPMPIPFLCTQPHVPGALQCRVQLVAHHGGSGVPGPAGDPEPVPQQPPHCDGLGDLATLAST